MKIHFLLKTTSFLLTVFLALAALDPCLLAQSAGSASSQGDGNTVLVKVKGSGESPEKAEKSALIRAVVKAVGAFIDQETLTQNDELIRDQILSVSSGFVKSFTTVSAPKKDLEGLYEVTLEVVVEKRKLEQALIDKGIVKVKSSGKDVWAEVFTKGSSASDALHMLETKLPTLLEKQFKVSFFEESPKPVLISRDSAKNTAKLLWWVKISSDTKFWYSIVAPMLDSCLSAIQENEKNDTSVIKGRYPNIAVAITQPVLGSEVRFTDLKSFNLSQMALASITTSFGQPFLEVNVKAGDELIAQQKIDPVANLSLLKEPKILESIPNSFSLGGILYFFKPRTPQNSSPILQDFRANYAFVPRPVETRSSRQLSGYAEVFLPETIVNRDRSGQAHNLNWPVPLTRAARPAEVAFPVIVDVPLDETQKTLEVSVSLKRLP